MTQLAVWAPLPERVTAIVDGQPVPTEPIGGGWWATADVIVAPGTRYAWELDGGAPRPDPRSPRQPSGLDGPSEVVDHGAFAWSDRGWRSAPLGSLVLYELHIGTFTPHGTFDAALEHLDHLVELGVNAIEVMPVATFPGSRGWGYDGVHLYAPHEAYGGPDGFKRFVDGCHSAGIAVVLDVVYNHLGPLGNHLAEFAPYFTDRVTTPWGSAVNLDGPGSDEVRRFLLDNAVQWLRDYHVDGLRLDAVHALQDESATSFLGDLRREVHALAASCERPLVVIAESDRNDPRLVEPPDVGGDGIDAMWCDDLHHSIHVAVTGERDGYYEDFDGSASEVADILRHGYRYRGQHSMHRRRRHGRPLSDATPRDRLVAFAQNHDQVGNRALGERLSHLVEPQRLFGAATVVLLGPAVPLLFQGEEWAASTPFQYFTDHPDDELARAVGEGRRAEFAAFGWDPESIPDPQDPGTWLRSCLRWSERAREPHATVLAWYRRLVALRRAEPDLRDPRADRIEVAADDAAGWVLVRRGAVCIAAQLGRGAHVARVALPGKAIEPLLLSPGANLDGGTAVLPPGGALVVRVLDSSGEVAAQPPEHAVQPS